METFSSSLVAGVASGSVISLILGFALHRARVGIEKEIENRFDEALEIFKSEREWKEKSLYQLLAPLVMHLERTSRIANRYRKITYRERGKSWFDAKLLKESNNTIKSILLSSGHLLPANLIEPANELVEHYDLWESRFDEKVLQESPNEESIFDVGFTEKEFPRHAVDEFKKAFDNLRTELYSKK